MSGGHPVPSRPEKSPVTLSVERRVPRGAWAGDASLDAQHDKSEVSGRAPSQSLEDIEIRLLLEAVFRWYGHDFRDYSPASLKRRILSRLAEEEVASVSELQAKVLHDPACMQRLLVGISVTVSSMFRDPDFYRVLRAKVLPLLGTYPFIRVWHAGCSTGEEAYSLAILLHEEGLYGRSRIYATDMNEVVLQKAQAGVFPIASMKEYTANYLKSGGHSSLSDYYTAMYDGALFRPALKQNIVFSQHNLATDGSFNEFHLIMCRNVLIYFNKSLQARVHKTLLESLARLGFLALGSKESLLGSPFEASYEAFDGAAKVYRRTG